MATAKQSGRRQATLLALSVFALLLSFYLVKPAREALLATSSLGVNGAELRAIATVGQGLFAFVLAGWYSRLADRLPRRALVTAIDGLFAALLAGTTLRLRYPQVLPTGCAEVAIYVITGALGVIVIAQFWAFATDLEGRRAGRMLPLLALAASAGGATGAYAARSVVAMLSDPLPVLFLAAAGSLCAAAVFSALADRVGFCGAPAAAAGNVATDDGTKAARTIDLLLSHKYLLGTAVVTLLAQWVSTNGENLLFGFVQEALQASGDEQVASGTMAFYASFSLWSNLGALAVQLAVVYGCERGRSGRDMLLVLPVVTLASATAMLFVPALGAIKFLKVAENATRHSIHNTAAQLLWLPTTAAMKYKAKIVIETVVVRLADGLAALTAFIGLRLLQVPLQGLYVFNVLLVVAWMVAAVILVREQRQRLRATAKVTALPLRSAAPRSMPRGFEYNLAA